MKRFYIYIILILTHLTICDFAHSQVVRDSIKIHFRKGGATLQPLLEDNADALKRIADSLSITYTDSIYKLRDITVIGSASPEGSIDLNKRLSEKRANVLFDYLSQYETLPDSAKTFVYIGRNWEGLLQLVQEDDSVPYRNEVIELLEDIVAKCLIEESATDNNMGRLMDLKGGEPYRYMYQALFPELRTSHLILSYNKVYNLKPFAAPRSNGVSIPDSTLIASQVQLEPVAVDFVVPRPFYMALKTNMLYDVTMTPNIGAEFLLGAGVSVAANYQHAWWKNDSKLFYWRIYGAELSARYWFGRQSKLRPLSGHHVGIYAQTMTYDFLLNGKGYMAGKDGGNIFNRATWNIGAEYGYSLPIARRLSIDFALGAGYMWGKYYEYLPDNGCYVWQATKMRRWFGPTKAEVSLVWLLDVNIAKGGKR